MSKLKKTLYIFLAITILAFSVILFASAETTNSIGDVNGDGKISASDARLALRASVGLEKLTDTQFKSADVNNDNKVTASDARTILRVSVGLENFEIKSEYDTFSDNWHFGIDDDHVVITDEYGNGYVDNLILIQFKTKDIKIIEKVISTINGTVIGNSDYEYQVQIEVSDLESIKKICEDISKMDEVWMAFPYYTIQSDIERIPGDPWKDTFQGITGVNWDEENPDGLNWWIEAIQAPSAWEYNDRFSNIKIGVVDNGFDTNHEDLQISVLNNYQNSFEDHGTHVAGIIGATANNETGITGIVWNKELYGVDVHKSSTQNDNIAIPDIYEGIQILLKFGCKTVNLSLGGLLKNNFTEIYESGMYAANAILFWQKELGIKDFIIIDSAGNENVESVRGAHFCSITDEVLEKYFDTYEDELKEYSYEDVYSHFIVAGAIEKTTSGYQMTDFSNYGSKVSVCAPGKDIFSTVVMGGSDGNYAHNFWDGTSMSAPIVTGVASLVWSVNENFSAGEVKDIVCNYYNKTANGYADGDTRNYPIVNAKLAVEEAIRRTDKAGTISGFVKDSTTGKAIEGVQVSAEVGNAKRYVLTDANGNFKIELPEDEYELVFEYNGYVTKKVKTICEKNVSTVLLDTVYLTPTANLIGYVIDKETAQPVEGASILLQQIDEGGMIVGEITCSTDANGQFSVNTPVGTYTYTINKLDNMFEELYETATGTVTVEKADGNILGTVYLTPKPTATVSGIVQDKNTNEAIPYVTIQLINSENVPVWTDITNENGEFVFDEKIPYGTYTIKFTHDNYETSEYTMVIDAEEVKITELLVPSDTRSVTASGNCGADGDNVTWTLYEDGELVISGSGEMYNYSSTEKAPWYSNRLSFTSVVIKDSINNIGEFAFYDCSNLINISIPITVTNIGKGAFYSCKNLTTIEIPNNVSKIGSSAFAYCKKLSEINIPANVTSIDSETFYQCENLKEINIPSVAKIGFHAFGYCYSLTSIKIPNSLTSLDISAFKQCLNLENILVDTNNQHYSSVDGVLFNKNKTKLLKHPAGNKRTEYNIPNGVTTISGTAFDNCANLISIILPHGVTAIGKNAFEGCINLTTINIPRSVTKVGDNAFGWCKKLTTINIPDSVSSIGKEVFDRCIQLENIIVDTNNQYYSSNNGVLFNKNETVLISYPAGNKRLEYNIPNNVISIEAVAFNCCKYLSSVNMPNSLTDIGSGAFEYCEKLIDIIIPKDIKSIGNGAFFDCTNLTDVYYAGTEEEWKSINIGYNAFYRGNGMYSTIHYNN